MLFGLANAPAVFQAMVSNVLQDFFNQYAFIYLDDILFSLMIPRNTTYILEDPAASTRE